MRRCDSAAIVPNTSELLPEPETPVNTVSRRLGSSTLTSLRLFTRAPVTRIRSWLSAGCTEDEFVAPDVALLIWSPCLLDRSHPNQRHRGLDRYGVQQPARAHGSGRDRA